MKTFANLATDAIARGWIMGQDEYKACKHFIDVVGLRDRDYNQLKSMVRTFETDGRNVGHE